MKPILLFEQWINEERPEWHDSDAPDAEGRFKELSPKDLAAWLIKTRNKDLRKITGSLNQQIVFNRGEDKAYADKMEKTRKEVYKQLGREDLLEAYNINKYSPTSYAKRVADGSMSFHDAQQESGMPFTELMKLVKKIDKTFKLTFEANENESTSREKLDNADINKALDKKAKESGVPIGILRAVMRRGMGAWNSSHRAGVSQEAWGYARVNAFLEKGEGTWQKADADLAKEVRDAGKDKKLPYKVEESLNESEDSFNDYPAAAKANAKKALEWRDKYGRDEVDAGTAVGWQRANQLAKGEKVSKDVVSRMAQFNRHRKNSTIASEYKDTPWKDRGYVAWLIWGGTEGVDWAMKKMDQINKEKE